MLASDNVTGRDSYDLSKPKRMRTGSISGRLRTASDLEESGLIDKTQKGLIKDLIISGDAALFSALEKYEKGDSSELKELLSSGEFAYGRSQSIDLLDGLDFDFLNGIQSDTELNGIFDNDMMEPREAFSHIKNESEQQHPKTQNQRKGSLDSCGSITTRLFANINPDLLEDFDGFDEFMNDESLMTNRGSFGFGSEEQSNEILADLSGYERLAASLKQPNGQMNYKADSDKALQMQQFLLSKFQKSVNNVQDKTKRVPVPNKFSKIDPNSIKKENQKLPLKRGHRQQKDENPFPDANVGLNYQGNGQPPSGNNNFSSAPPGNFHPGLNTMYSTNAMGKDGSQISGDGSAGFSLNQINNSFNKNMTQSYYSSTNSNFSQHKNIEISNTTGNSMKSSGSNSVVRVGGGRPVVGEGPSSSHGTVLSNIERGPGYIGIYSPEQRRLRLERFLEKRTKRVWTKKVKYDVRKNFADSRLRVKGRFVKKEDEDIMREILSIE